MERKNCEYMDEKHLPFYSAHKKFLQYGSLQLVMPMGFAASIVHTINNLVILCINVSIHDLEQPMTERLNYQPIWFNNFAIHA